MAHSTRPTLPPLHTLDLPRGDIPRMHDSDDLSRWNPHSNCHQCTAFPQTPAPCLRPRTNAPAGTPTPTAFPARKIRLVPTSFENADAVVLVLPPSVPNAPPPQPLLLVGPALARLRHPQGQLARGARVHPYRIARPADRRPPTVPSHTKP
ncbi:hypothetical protein OG21DRAFT_1512495 [Imleria badia]|nr:hypothetical protein OG21DRAFT_1512495 [Imleria badia]